MFGTDGLDSTLEHAPVAIRVLDAFGVVTMVNSAWARLLERDASEWIGRPVTEWVVAPAAMRQSWGRRLAGVGEGFQCAFVRPEGGEVSVWLDSSPVFDAHGCVTGAVEAARPAGGGALEAGRTSDSVCGRLVEESPAAVWACDAQERVWFANPAFHRLTGLAALPAGPELFPGKAGEEFQALARRARESLKPVCFDGTLLCLEAGRTALVSGWIAPRVGEGRYQGAAGLAWEVTHRQEAQIAVRERRDHLERVFSGLAAPVVVWNRDWRVIQTNRAMEELTGAAAARVVGRPLGGLFPAQERRKSLGRLEEALAKSPVQAVDLKIIDAQGRFRRTWWRLAILPGPDDRGEAFSAVLETEWSTPAIDKKPDVRPASAAAPRPEAPENLRETAARVVRELRSPLTVAAGATDLLAKHFDQMGPARRQEVIALARSSIQKAADCLKDLEKRTETQEDPRPDAGELDGGPVEG